MGLGGLEWQAVQIPFTGGLNQKGDKRAQNPPVLDIAKDVEFDEPGGLRTRKPYAALGTNILGGGTISNPRRIVANGDELLLFTDTALYSWDVAGSVWVLKSTYLAPKVEEATQFATNADQVDCDRAELSNVIFYTWIDGIHLYIATQDKTTGATIAITEFSSGTTAGSGNRRPRLIALSTRVLLFFVDGSGNLRAAAFDPASPSGSSILATGTTTVLSAASGFNLIYDAVRSASSDTAVVVMRRNPTTSYTIATVTAALTVTTSTKARTCDGCIAVSVTPNGVSAQVVRNVGASNAIVGDLITVSSLADVYTGQAIGTTSASNGTQIAACHRSVTDGGQYRCYVFWDNGDTPATTGTNWVDDANNLGTAAAWVRYLTPRSRAFDYNGRIYVWAIFAQPNETGILPTFGSALQNTLFLYRDDNLLIAKAAAAVAGEASSQGRLPGVVATAAGVYEWCGSVRRIITVGSGSSGYGERAPRNIKVTFDSNEARRCVRLGKTLYIAGGQVSMYDGSIVTEVGFPISPWLFAAGDGGAGGNLLAGTYAVKATYRRENAQGEIERSTTTNVGTFTATATHKMTALGIGSLTVGNKLGTTAFGGINYGGPAVEFWRTTVNPTEDSPFYLVTSKDPAATSNPNRYLSNDPTSATTVQLDDTLSDTSLATKENNPENGSVLENLAPPPGSIIAADQYRLYLAGIAGAPNVVWYSKQRSEGEIAAFNDALTIQLPATGGDITALAFLNETLIVFKETAIYALPGDGYDNTGGGQNFGPARLLSSDCGAVNQESVAFMPDGLVFKSSKGWYLLDRGWGVQYIGAAVVDYDSETPLAVQVVTSQHQVRVLSSSRMLIWDYVVETDGNQHGQWGEWTISDGLDSTIWNGAHVYLSTTGPKSQQTTYAATDYGMDVETDWIKPADLQGSVSVRRFEILGEYVSTCHLRIRVAYDYQYDASGNTVYTDDRYWSPSPTTATSALQVRCGTSRKKCEAIKVRVTAVSTNNDGLPASGGGSIKLTALTLEVGRRRGLYQRLPAAQKA